MHTGMTYLSDADYYHHDDIRRRTSEPHRAGQLSCRSEHLVNSVRLHQKRSKDKGARDVETQSVTQTYHVCGFSDEQGHGRYRNQHPNQDHYDKLPVCPCMYIGKSYTFIVTYNPRQLLHRCDCWKTKCNRKTVN